MTLLDLVTFVQVIAWVCVGLIARDLGSDLRDALDTQGCPCVPVDRFDAL